MQNVRRLQRLLPGWLYRNIVTLSILAFVVLMGWILWSAHEASVKANNAAREAKRVAHTNTRLALENRRRIAEIQASRLLSCRQNYQTLIDAFEPIDRAQRSTETPQQRARANAFFKGLRDKKANCAKQVGAKVLP